MAVTPDNPVLQQAPQTPAPAVPAEAAPAVQLVAAAADVPAPPAVVANIGTDALEVAPCPPSIPSEWHEPAQDTLRPSQVELVPALSERAPRKPVRKILLAAALVALVGVIGLVVSSTRSKPDLIAAIPTAATIVHPSRAATAVPSPAVKPPSTAVTTAAPVTSRDAPGLVESAKSALLGPDDTALVTVRISPSSAVVFKGGQRFGTGEVTLNVVRGTKTTLFARLDGYLPRTIVVDGTKASVNITLSRPPSARVTAARKPAEEVSASSPKSDEANSGPVDESSAGAAKRADTASSETPSNFENPYESD